MKFSIVINTHNQKKFLIRSINSCIRQEFENFEILIFDTSDKKINSKNLKFLKKKKIKYYHFKEKFDQPEKNQMYKIFLGMKKSKGHYICLLDGDDYFQKNKLKNLNSYLYKNKISFVQDVPILAKSTFKKKKILKLKLYKNNYIYKKIINNWPQIFGTSSITVKKKVLENFFKKAKPFKWKYLAIDIQLAIFCYYNFKIHKLNAQLTIKNLHDNNLGDKYLNILKKKFWIRRHMQHKYESYLNKKKILNFDYIVTSLINAFC